MNFLSILILSLFTAVSALAQTQLPISYVASNGTNANPLCTRVSPCRHFLYAALRTEPGGTIIALDAADYLPLTIDKPLTIDGNGSGAHITVGTGGGDIGVEINTAGHVEIRNVAIHVHPRCTACDGIVSKASYVTIENVAIDGPARYGVSVTGAHAVIHGLTVTGAVWGIESVSATAISVTDSVIRYATTGIHVVATTGNSQAMIERTRIVSGITGLDVDGVVPFIAAARISDSVIFGNTTGAQAFRTGQIITLRNNSWAGNITDGAAGFSGSLK